MLIIDTNSAEDFMYDYCILNSIPVKRQRLDVGDIVIYHENTEFILERKTWSDLSPYQNMHPIH